MDGEKDYNYWYDKWVAGQSYDLLKDEKEDENAGTNQGDGS